jgi:hypothetical protein
MKQMSMMGRQWGLVDRSAVYGVSTERHSAK